uniref:Beta/gamma crystallin 'Greek key' domain-containing protein n=1 Tax=Anabas testudineus TaxID=64144 RepID=A0A3Q1HME3_ANATE
MRTLSSSSRTRNQKMFKPNPTNVTLSCHPPDAPGIADNTTPSGEKSVGSDIFSTITESHPAPHKDDCDLKADSATVNQEFSVSRVRRSIPETVKSASITSAVSSENSVPPVSQDAVYGELYDSLFPAGFTSETVSSLSNPLPEIHMEMRHLNTKSDPVTARSRNECRTETNVIYSHLSTSHAFAGNKKDDDESSYTNKQGDNTQANFSERKVVFSSETSQQSSVAFDILKESDIRRRDPPYSLNAASEPVRQDIHYSELSHSHSEVKSDNFSLIQESVRSVPELQNAAAPVSGYVTSQGADTQVTDSKRRVILVKELVTDEASTNLSHCPSPVPDKMSSLRDLEVKIETPGQMDGHEGFLSPAYLSVGSDDGSAMEIYYSAEEDNSEQSGDEEMQTIDEREDNCMVHGLKEVLLHEEQGEIGERQTGKRYEGDLRVVILKMQNEEGQVGDEEKTSNFSCQTEATQQLEGQRNEFLPSNDGKSQQKALATTALPQTKEGEEGRKEELLATPVEQVNTLMVCKVIPPSGELHGQGEGPEGNWTQNLETEAHPNGKQLFPKQEVQDLTYKDIRRSEYMHAAPSKSRQEDAITTTVREAEEEHVSETAHESQEGRKKSRETDSSTTTNAVSGSAAGLEVVTGSATQNAELQSDATEVEHNRAPRQSKWADTITQSTDKYKTVREQVAVKLSASNTDTHHPDTEAAQVTSEGHEHVPEAQTDLDQGSLTASSASTKVLLASDNQQLKENQESLDKMSLGYSSLSTTLTIKNLCFPKEDESKHRIHKVSLVNEADTANGSCDTVDFAPVSNGTDLSPDYKWKNNFDMVSQYKPSKQEDFSFSDNYSSTSHLSSLSALPEAATYKYHSKTFSSSSSEQHIVLGNTLSDRTEVYLSRESEPAGELKDGWRRGLVEQEEPSAPAGGREGEGEAESERIKSHWDSQQLPVSYFSSALQTGHADCLTEEDDDSSLFTGVFKATFVELVPDPAAPPSTPPDSPDADSSTQFDMNNLMDTLKSMGPSQRPRSLGPRAPPQPLVSSLPPIVEDAPNLFSSDFTDSHTSPTKKIEATAPAETPNGLYTLPADLGLKRTSARDTRSPLELMKHNQQDQQHSGTRGLTLPLRASATNSIVMKNSSDSSPEELKSPVLNGNGVLPSSSLGSRLDNSLLFRSYRSSSTDLPQENGKPHRPLFHTNSLPEVGPANDRVSAAPKELGEPGTRTDTAGTRFDRFSYLLNSSSSASGSLTGAEDPSARMSRPPPLSISSPPSSNISTPILQRSLSNERLAGVQQSPLFNSVLGGSQFQCQEPEPDRNLLMKYRAFPDAYLTKEKKHGKLNPRPGKMYIFDQPGMCGQRIEVRSDVIDATPWELQETISIRVVRGGWVLYEKPNFKGEKIALDEGDIELTCPFSPPEEPMENSQRDGEETNGETSSEQTETKPARRFIIGSVRRAVRDYSVPEICLFPEENAEGKKVIFRDTSDDARIFGFPIKANSIIINAGLWLVFAQPFFQGDPRVLEVGGYPNPASWGVEQPYVGSVHPLKIGVPRVENMGEPQMVIYEKPYFTGKSRTITTNMRDFMTRIDRQQTVFMYNIGSLKVLGGIWVGYEKEGYRGHQYLLEEGEYHDWRVWGGCNSELRSVRVIRADLTDPLMVMIEQPEEERDLQEEKNFEVTEAIPDVELFGYKTSTCSIQVISGAWVAYSDVDFSGNQYILEKGFYSNCADWGSEDNRICSVQPILLAPDDNSRSRNEIILFSEPDFQGNCHVFDRNQEAVPENLLTKSCRVMGGSWVLYEDKEYSGNLYVLSEGEYPNLTSMGCPPGCTLRSVKIIPMTLSVPSISLFGLECLEGREITADTEIISMVEEGFNNHVLSVKVNSGYWVICEHSNYRGRQFLLEPIEITNWPKYSSLDTIGSMYPVRQKRHFFRIKNKERGHFMSIQGGVEEMKSGRVVVTPEVEPMSDIWFYQDGLIKNKLSQTMCLQVMGNVEPGNKVALWTETRQPILTWAAQMEGLIACITFPGLVLDVKGGKGYDKDHVVIMSESEERPSQQWEIELL